MRFSLFGVQRGSHFWAACRRHYSPPSITKGSKGPTKPPRTMDEIKQKMIQRLGLEPGYTLRPQSREHLLKYVPKREELPPRSMQDSFSTAIIPLSTNRRKQDKYMNYHGMVRKGRLMEDMDLFAVWCCHKHLKVPTLPEGVHLPYTFVTILVDSIDFAENRTLGSQDIYLSGHVSWVGFSSLEVVVWLEQMSDGELNPVTRALFLMGARNATNTAAAPVNPIEPANKEERAILEGAAERIRQRKERFTTRIDEVEPTAQEESITYELYKRTNPSDTLELNKRILPENCRWMDDSFQTTIITSFPEDRNQHNRVFGGFLMRIAMEITWATAFIYSKSRPILLHISHVAFQKPVPVDSLIKMTAYVVYTKRNYLQIMAVGEVIEKDTGERETTNTFNFTYAVEAAAVPEVLPRSFHETIWYIHGRRKFESSGVLKEAK